MSQFVLQILKENHMRFIKSSSTTYDFIRQEIAEVTIRKVKIGHEYFWHARSRTGKALNIKRQNERHPTINMSFYEAKQAAFNELRSRDQKYQEAC
jgi:hypothetical protein